MIYSFENLVLYIISHLVVIDICNIKNKLDEYLSTVVILQHLNIVLIINRLCLIEICRVIGKLLSADPLVHRLLLDTFVASFGGSR